MDDTFDQLFDSVEKSPSYWMQVALLEFLQSLDAMRASKGVLSNAELARLVGVSPPTLSRWLNGNENLTISTMCRLAAALGAAVHIQVADNTKKGRWKEESGESRSTSSSGVTTVQAHPSNILAYRNVRDLAVTPSSSAAPPEPVSLRGGR